MFKLLQRRSVPSRLVIFPDANHWVLKGEDGRQHMKEVLDWLAKYI
jgi:dipeptidyl aminopeptidase/acylaminoacyl peptidase